MSHTPGPWIFDETNWGVYSLDGLHAGWTIGEIRGGKTNEEVRANGQLVAAAPEMLAALQLYANPEIYKPHPHGPAFDRRDLSDVAKAVIAKLEAGR